MRTIDPSLLNANFGITKQLTFDIGPGDLPIVTIRNHHATATISVQGAQALTFQPHDEEPVLWLSPRSRYKAGRSIRGGIPICWPWFGPHPSDADKPQHGFARTLLWEVLGTAVGEGDTSQIRFGLHDSEQTRALWPYAFALECAVTVGPALEVALTIRNTDDVAWTWSGALHTYLAVQDVARIAVHGLDGVTYADKVDDYERKTQHGVVRIDGEVDRVYLATTAICTVDDPLLERRIEIDKSGSRSTVVWNPWEQKSREVADLGEDAYRGMVCVETANALDDVQPLAPGAEHTMRVRLAVTR